MPGRRYLLIALLPLAVACSRTGQEGVDTPSRTAQAAPAPTHHAIGPEDVVAVRGAQRQIRAAVTAAPLDLREGAAVLGYAEDGSLVALRAGTNGLTCLADDPSDDRFQVACYHDTLTAYMERGRELRAEGMGGPDSLLRRHEEIDAGTLAMPSGPTTVYNLGGPLTMLDPESGAVDEAQGRRVYSLYIPYATEESTGLSTTPPAPGAPWIMRPGTPTAHVMVVLEPAATPTPD